jgi:hypothetical protein
MLNLDLPLAAILELKPAKAAELCDQVLEIDKLVESLDAGDPFTRKGLCEYLGIGESTLSGWIKEGRIPRMAKNAIVLLVAQQLMAAEVRRLRGNDLYVVRSGDRFQVCELREDEEGEPTGRVLADNIGSIEDARLLASGRRALRVIDQVRNSGVIEYALEICDDESFLDGVHALDDALEAHQLHLSDHASWKTRYGRKSRQGFLDDFLADSTAKEEQKT